MRGLPDSAVYGTYKRIKRIGKPRRRKSRQMEAELLYDIVVLTTKLLKNINKEKTRK